MPEKPAKPNPDFPLFPHSNGQWAKKIKGRMVYFGPWADPDAALDRFKALGDGPPDNLAAVVKKYLAALEKKQEVGEVGLRHYKSMEWILGKLKKHIDTTKSFNRLTPDDYRTWRNAIAKTNKAVALSSHIRHVRAFLNWAVAEKIIPGLPPGDCLKKPSVAQLRVARVERGSRMFTAKELRRLIECAGPEMRAMIFLALNAGLGNEDLAQLKTQHMQGVWLDYPRPKTGIERRVPLWPETRKALAAVIRSDDEIVFRTKYGNSWTAKGKMAGDSPISAKFRKLCQGIGIHKPGRGFYSLRHVCQTIGEEAGDHPAIEYILGHAPMANDMSAVYRERMADKRLIKVVRHIRRWLQPDKIDTSLYPQETPLPVVNLPIPSMPTVNTQ